MFKLDGKLVVDQGTAIVPNGRAASISLAGQWFDLAFAPIQGVAPAISLSGASIILEGFDQALGASLVAQGMSIGGKPHHLAVFGHALGHGTATDRVIHYVLYEA